MLNYVNGIYCFHKHINCVMDNLFKVQGTFKVQGHSKFRDIQGSGTFKVQGHPRLRSRLRPRLRSRLRPRLRSRLRPRLRSRLRPRVPSRSGIGAARGVVG